PSSDGPLTDHIADLPARWAVAAAHAPYPNLGPAVPWVMMTQPSSSKGSFASVCLHRFSYHCPTTIFRDLRNGYRHHLSATLPTCGWKRLVPVITTRSQSLGRRFPNAG